MSEEEARTGTDGVSEEGPLDPKKVETEVELSDIDLSGYDTIGVTAGTSTPNWVIRKVMQKLKK